VWVDNAEARAPPRGDGVARGHQAQLRGVLGGVGKHLATAACVQPPGAEAAMLPDWAPVRGRWCQRALLGW
jgi:hypothetical protein